MYYFFQMELKKKQTQKALKNNDINCCPFCNYAILLFYLQKKKIREQFVSVLREEFKGKGLTFSIGKPADNRHWSRTDTQSR